MARPRLKDKHLPKYVRPIHGSYWYRAPKQKPVKLARVGDESTMYRKLADIVRHVPALPIFTVCDLLERFERECVPQLSPPTQVDYRRSIGKLREVFAGVAVGDVTRRHVGKILASGKHKAALNKLVAVLSSAYSKGVGTWFVCDDNPCKGITLHKSKRNRYVSDDEYAAVYALASPRIRIAMDLALLTRQRQSDLLSLKWASVTDEGVYFQQSKTGKRLEVSKSAALDEVLARAKKLVPQLPREFVLRNEFGQRYTRTGFKANWQRLMIKAKKLGVIAERFTFHDLRAKSVSDSATLQEGFEGAGHSDIALTRSVYERGIRKVKPLK